MSRIPFLAPNPRNAWGRMLLALDARPKLAFALLVGMILWRLPLPILLNLALLGGLSCHALGAFTRLNMAFWRLSLFFVGTWFALKFGLDLWGGSGLETGLKAAGELGVRLLTLVLLGFTLTLSTSPRRLGQAMAWYLQPLLGQRAWRVALALALMIHFLPLSLAAASGLNQGLHRRWPGCPWLVRLRLIPQAVLRVLSQTTWTQAMAVAARNLDQPKAWQPDRSVHLWEWLLALIPALLLIALSAAGSGHGQ